MIDPMHSLPNWNVVESPRAKGKSGEGGRKHGRSEEVAERSRALQWQRAAGQTSRRRRLA